MDAAFGGGRRRPVSERQRVSVVMCQGVPETRAARCTRDDGAGVGNASHRIAPHPSHCIVDSANVLLASD